MYRVLTDEVRTCLYKAEELNREAESSKDAATKAFLRERARVWIKLSESYRFQQRLMTFLQTQKLGQKYPQIPRGISDWGRRPSPGG